MAEYTSNGGGATHIAKVTGQLKNLSSNLSDILIVSGGGGGGYLVGENAYAGKDAGGISGNGNNSANQTTGNAFGLGESGTNLSGGGSGLYGGYKGTSSKSGGAGSGYIGNSLLSNKKMVGYNVPTSSAEGTKTESVNDVSASAVSGKPKSGNGHARIKLLQEITALTLEQITNGGQISQYTTISHSYQYGSTPPWDSMDGRLLYWSKYNGRPLQYDSNGGYFYFSRKSGDSESNFAIPLPSRLRIAKVTFDWMNSYRPTQWTGLGIKVEDTTSQVATVVSYFDAPVMSDYESVTVEFDTEVFADYLYFFAWDGEFKIKNLKLYGLAQGG